MTCTFIASTALLSLHSDGFSAVSLNVGVAFLLPLYWAIVVLVDDLKALRND